MDAQPKLLPPSKLSSGSQFLTSESALVTVSPGGSQDAYLKVKLDTNTRAAISVKDTEEAITVSWHKLTLMPNLPFWNLGLLYRNGQVFWVVDLAALLQLEALDRNSQKYNVVIAKIGDLRMGLAVQEIDAVINLNMDLTKLTHEKSNLNRHVRGCVLCGGELLLVLNTNLIMHSPLLHPE